jgi:allophanate hydrolase
VLSVDGPTVDLFVVGAHLAGLPLNPQLTARGGRLARAAATAAAYSLHVLDGGAKPGLVKRGEAEARGSVRGEVWTLPLAGFATFVAECVPAPLSIGTVDLDDGTHVKGFLCEAAAAAGADDITALGGWREFVKTKAGA